ncbi:MAG: PAS domain S-box protein [Planctomycetales bacterium]|nr:MAG: PAS domain S-box protein [Planctomycetales bacterium]
MQLNRPDLEIVAITGGQPGAHVPLQANLMSPALFIGLCGLAGCLYLALLLSRSRRQLEAIRGRLQESHDNEAELSGRLHVLEHSAPDAVLTISPEGFIDGFNRAAERLFGYSAAEIVNHHFRELFPEPEDGECHLNSVVHGNGNDLLGSVREVSAQRRDGSLFTAECSAAELTRSGQRGVLAIVRDVSAQRMHERLLEQSELRLREAQQLARLGNLELDLQDGRMFWSDELFHQFGLEAGQVEPDMRLLISLVHPEDRDGIEMAMDSLIRQGSCHEQSYRLLPGSGLQRWHHARFIVDRNESGQALRLLATVQDVTEQHSLAETRRRMEEKLDQIRKLETIGSVSSAIAHDFNNILTPIIGFTDLGLEETESSSSVHRHLQQVRRGASRARELVQRILSFSDSPQQEPNPVALRSVAEEVLGLLSVRAGRRVRLELHESGGPHYVMADATHLHQVLLNLCTNALQAIGTGEGRISVALETVNIDLGSLERLPALKLGPHVLLSVRDDGSGISRQDMELIFQPFFSSRPGEGGSGIGLSVVHGIVLSHGGEIEVESRPGSGSCFRVYLPLCRELPSRSGTTGAELEQDELELRGTGESILFVDDEPDINRLVVQQLERLGYRVSTCRQPAQALDLLREQPGSFQLLVTDLTMPRMDGEKLVRSLRASGEMLPVIMITGYSEGLPRDIMEELRIETVVNKPLEQNSLASAIRRVLGPVSAVPAND